MSMDVNGITFNKQISNINRFFVSNSFLKKWNTNCAGCKPSNFPATWMHQFVTMMAFPEENVGTILAA